MVGIRGVVTIVGIGVPDTVITIITVVIIITITTIAMIVTGEMSSKAVFKNDRRSNGQ